MTFVSYYENTTRPRDVNVSSADDISTQVAWSVVMALVVLEATLAVACLAANGLVIAAFSLNKRLHHNVTNFYLLQLSLVNALTGLASAPHMAGLLTSHARVCAASHVSVLTACGMSSMSLLVISYDRFLAIAGPFKYRTHICRRRVFLHCVATYCIPIAVFVILPMFWHSSNTASQCSMCAVFAPNYLAFVAAPFFGVVTCLLVFFVATTRHLHAQRMRSVEKLIASMPFNWSRNSAQRRSARLTRTNSLVLSTFLVCWTPFLVNLALQVSAPTHTCTDSHLPISSIF